MIVVRFKIKCRREKTDQVRAALAAAVGPSRAVEGVIGFDIAQDLTDADSFIATEVFTDRAALARQESLPEVQAVIALLPDVLAAEPEATVYNVSSAEPWGA
ncbi:MAG: putative quinol monooxygenase [Acidobacteriota bacterium]